MNLPNKLYCKLGGHTWVMESEIIRSCSACERVDVARRDPLTGKRKWRKGSIKKRAMKLTVKNLKRVVKV